MEENRTMIAIKSFHRSPQLAELKVSYKRRKTPDGLQLRMPWILTSSQSAEEYLRTVWDPHKLELVEDLYLVCLNGAQEALGWVRVSSGGFDRTIVDARLIFGIALQAASSAIVLAHNHPSGEVTPSDEDRHVTRKLRAAGDVLGLPLLDHIILTKDAAFSFADEGLM
jgi:DNA repair protein RadC